MLFVKSAGVSAAASGVTSALAAGGITVCSPGAAWGVSAAVGATTTESAPFSARTPSSAEAEAATRAAWAGSVAARRSHPASATGDRTRADEKSTQASLTRGRGMMASVRCGIYLCGLQSIP